LFTTAGLCQSCPCWRPFRRSFKKQFAGRYVSRAGIPLIDDPRKFLMVLLQKIGYMENDGSYKELEPEITDDNDDNANNINSLNEV
ncbi:24428_t:CDS:2, partial [Racocetra persica]